MTNTPASITTLHPNEICLKHNIRASDDNGVPLELVANDADFIASVEAQGILVRCTVKFGPCEHERDYVAVAGHRRITAEALARGWDTGEVPVEIITQDRELDVVTMLVENLQRSDLDVLDEARAYAELVMTHGWKQSEVAASVGRAQSHVTERLALLGLSDEAKVMLQEGKLPIRSALKLVRETAEVQAKVLSGHANLSESGIEWEIKDAKAKIQAQANKAKAIGELEGAGWTVLKRLPEGSAQVVLKGDDNFYAGNPLRLAFTRAQFLKEPGSCVVVTTAAFSDLPIITFGTTAPEQYTGKEAPKADKIVEKPTPAEREPDEKQQQVDIVSTHRADWWDQYLAQPVDAKVALSSLLAYGWEHVRRWPNLAIDLKLATEDEDLTHDELARRLDAYIAGKPAKEQTRIIHLSLVHLQLSAGVSRWDPFEVPATLTKLGYEPHPIEVEAVAGEAQERAESWAAVRTAIHEEVEGHLDENETKILDQAMADAEGEGEWAEEFHHALIETAAERAASAA